jgi:3-hydroxyisobutyrate dehydrogenase-like beta-hydroxyacid dehydrogenase
MTMDVGFIGLGAMGSAMAANLVKAGHKVRAWNRSGDQGIAGVEMVAKPADAFQGDVVFTMLSDDPAIREVLLDAGVLPAACKGLVHVVTATISVEFAGELADAHEKAGLGYVSAPVLGRPNVAREGELNILTGGKSASVEKVRPLLEVLGKKIWNMGEDPKQANSAKIAANMMITMAIEAMAEAVVLTESTGVSRDTFFELILGTLFGSRAYESYSANIATGNYKPGFKAKLGLKDLRLATAIAETAGRRLPMLDAVRGRMSETVDAGLADKDWSVMADFTINQAK